MVGVGVFLIWIVGKGVFDGNGLFALWLLAGFSEFNEPRSMVVEFSVVSEKLSGPVSISRCVYPAIPQDMMIRLVKLITISMIVFRILSPFVNPIVNAKNTWDVPKKC
jgi:hypothetical protein